MQYEYKELNGYVYHIVSEPTAYLRKWLKTEWAKDAAEYPDQPWTLEWSEDLKKFEFVLEVIEIEKIRPRAELMAYEKNGYSFQKELSERVIERLEAIQMGTSIMPLVIRGVDMELMDGYTRYMALKHLGAKQIYAYIGHHAE
ncbi:MAG TPA: hypothetical protein VJB56_01960 [Candidatus Paceibacterota bacterium]